MSERLVHIATIEGIANSTGQLKFCYRKVPTSHAADAEYNAGLAERPSVTSGRWDTVESSLSIGRFNLSFRDRVGFNWMQTRPPVVLQCAEEVDDSETNILVDRDPTSITVGDILYSDRETWKVTAKASSPPSITVTRGYGGSTAEEHELGADVYTRPPVLIGRAVTVYETPVAGGTETVILRGFVSGEPAMGTHYPRISVTNTWRSKVFGQGLKDVPVQTVEKRPDLCQFYVETIGTDTTLRNIIPLGISGASGGYFEMPNGSVYRANYDATANLYRFDDPEHALVWGEEYVVQDDVELTLDARQILFSPLGGTLGSDVGYYPPFGRLGISGGVPDTGSVQKHDNPFIIVLNLLLTSIDGTNYSTDTWTYDLGPYSGVTDYGMWPEFGLGIPRAQVDLATFEDAVDRYADLHCDRLWLGGSNPEQAWTVIKRILSPLGYACGSNRAGTITLIRLQDVYPGTTSKVLSRDRNILPGTIGHQTQSRTVDQLTMEIDPGPDHRGQSRYVVTSPDSRKLYPEQVGVNQKFQDVPYSVNQFIGEASSMAVIVANRIRRLSGSVPIVMCSTNATGFDEFDLGTEATIYDNAIVDPTTGSRLTSTDEPLKGQVTNVRTDYVRRGLEVTVAVSDTGNVCLHSPSAAITAYDGGTKTITVTDSVYGGDPSDAEMFATGDKVVICDEHGVKRGADTVSSVASATSIILTTGVGGTVSGDILVYDEWDTVTSTQQESGYGWDADGGAPSTSYPSLGSGGDEPFVYGD